MEIKNPVFDSIVKGLNMVSLKHILVNGKTTAKNFPNNIAINHIFISKSWEVNKSGIIENKNLELAKRNCEQKRTKDNLMYYIKL